MNQDELELQEERPVFDIGLEWLRPLFNYTDTPGMLPVGAQITITGDPGTGKTRFLLQILDAVGRANPDFRTEIDQWELDKNALKTLRRNLGVTGIDQYEVFDSTTERDIVFKLDTIHGIDSLDFWANARYDEPYPSAGQAKYMLALKKAGQTVFVVHHKTKTGNKLSGSVDFAKVNDVIIDLKKRGKTVMLSCPTKNRWPGEVQHIELVHTAAGLEPAPPGPFHQALNALSQWWSS